MTTAQCNRPRRWSCLQCVSDGERTKDHENSARHATNKTNQQQYCMRHMPAAMMHGGNGVLLMILTKFASQETIKNTKITKNAIKAQSLTIISKKKKKHKITSKNSHTNKHPAPSKKLTVETQFFQMRKMHQR